MINLPQLEKRILKFWKKNQIFEKSLKQREKNKKFVFFEGPPSANAEPGIHHVYARVYKDIIPRYKTMRGYFCRRIGGWDAHGLPIEIEVEKKLGISSKPEIEKYGIEKFNQKCRESIFTYKKQWEEMTKRMGYWIDLKNAYITCTNEYIETVWWILKQIWDKELIYQDYKVLPYCPRCGTSLSDHEVAQGYKDVKDPSIYVKFKLKSQISNLKSYFLVWTTTPWTLPGNVALAISKDIDYVKVKNKDEELILAKDCLNVLDGKYDILERFKGKDLVGLEYEPLYNLKSYKVVAGDFVKTDEGTGIVHMAPAFGAEDLEVAKRENLPVILNVDEEGKFKAEVKPWAGEFVKEADPEIIFDLEKRGLLYKKETILHTYPFCWRCDTPLLYYAKNSWYIRTTAVKDKMLDNNEKINWIPAYIKHGRFGNWLKENIDWALSRERYWGTPLPFWVCQNGKSQISNLKSQNFCNNIKAIGSIKELKELSIKPINLKKLDLHRPYIDKIILRCEKCGGKMERVPEVIDCWFDSGSMPFAQAHFPFAFAQTQISNLKSQKDIKKLIKKLDFPADFIAEGIDQTRGWFYTLLAISTLLGLGPPYKNVISLGLVLDEKGQKMSKSKGNIIIPADIIAKYGADALRLYFFLSPLGETVRFSEKDLAEVFKKFMITLYNSFVFFETYASQKLKTPAFVKTTAGKQNLLDKWIISKLNQIIKEMTQSLDKHEITRATRSLYDFVINDLSNWYIRRSRKREESNFYQTLYRVLLDVCKLTAPFVPFISEEIYQNLVSSIKYQVKSIHLEDWPKADKKLINELLNEEMDLVRKICEMGLAIRAKKKIKVRQPLYELRVRGLSKSLNKELLNLIAEELNVKEVKLGELGKLGKDWLIKEENKIKIALSTQITPQLKLEGYARDIVRHIQELRKEKGLRPTDLVSTFWQTNDKKLLDVFKKFGDYIKKETRSRELKGIKGIKGVEGVRGVRGKELEVEGKKICIFVKIRNS